MNNVVIAKDFEFKSNKSYFFDNNIWIHLYAPLINVNMKKQKIASEFFKNLESYNSEIILTNLILSEFSNRLLRFNFEQWKKLPENFEKKSYKNDYKKSLQYKYDLNEVKLLVNKILNLNLINRLPDNFNSINLDNIINNFEIDYNDAYYVEQCSQHNWILVTSDNDFDNLNSNITIVKI